MKRTCSDVGIRRNRELRLTERFEDGARDVLFALRQLRRSPLVTIAAALTLALGIGVNSAMFSLADAVFMRPMPFPNPERLAYLTEVRTDTGLGIRVSPLNFADWRSESRSFSGMAAIIPASGRTVVGPDGVPERIPALVVTADYFDVLGVRPIMGRTFTATDTPGSGLVVISERFWRSRHGADPAIVGRGLRFDDQLLTVLGVVPNQLEMFSPAEIWVLTQPAQDRRSHYLHVIGRLAPGATLASAHAELLQIASGIAQQSPATSAGLTVGVQSLRETLIGREVRVTSLLLLGVVGFVLLMTCANVASLLLARTAARGREIAVRTALGAGRRRIVGQFLIESLVLAVIGGGLGLGLGAAILQGVPAVMPADLLPATVTLTFDLRVFLFCVVTTGVAGLLFGLTPAWHASRMPPAEALAGNGRVTRSAGRIRQVLATTEVAVAVLLLCGAGLLLRTLSALQRVDTGYQTEGVLAAGIALPFNRYANEEQQLRFYEAVEQEISRLPGVKRVAWGTAPPLAGAYYAQTFEIAGDPPITVKPSATYQMVSAPYFDVLGIPIVSGRPFSADDRGSSPPVCIVDEAFVRQFLHGRDPLGLRIAIPAMNRVPGPPVAREVVGVARHVKERPGELEERAQVYVPIAQDPWASATLMVAPENPRDLSLARAVRGGVAAVGPELPLMTVRTLEDIAYDATSRPRFRAVLVAAFAALALGLATIGVFGVVAYSVQQRSREFAVRRALGATGTNVLRLVLGGAVRLGLVGGLAGLVLAALLTQSVETLLFDVDPLDPGTFAIVGLLAGLTVLCAAVGPAIRASLLDPASMLREE